MSVAFYNPPLPLTASRIASGSQSSAWQSEHSLVDTTDRELVDRFLAGSQKERELAFAALYTRHQSTVFNIAYGVVNSNEDAENVVQETFIKVHRNLDGFAGKSQFSTWLHTVTKNTALNYKAHEERRPQSSGVDPTAIGIATQQSPQADFELDELKESLNNALNTLTEELRQTLVFVVEDGLSYEQVAKITDVPVGTVRSRVFRARQAIDKFLLKNAPGYREYAK